MPKNYPRIEFKSTRETRNKLELLRKQALARYGKKVSMSDLVNAIISDFLRQEDALACILSEKE